VWRGRGEAVFAEVVGCILVEAAKGCMASVGYPWGWSRGGCPSGKWGLWAVLRIGAGECDGHRGGGVQSDRYV
jgi:hypothetical protein